MQFLIAVLINIFIVFRALGKNYDAAVVCAGFGGISLGSTPTAMANMTAVSSKYGPSQLAFIIVPLVCAFFIDLANAVMIPYFLENFWTANNVLDAPAMSAHQKITELKARMHEAIIGQEAVIDRLTIGLLANRR